MNIIFLDIDGVLNNTVTMWLTHKYIDSNCLDLFMNTVKRIPDCKIVLSSSWRKENKEKFVELINKAEAYELFQLFPFFHDDYCTPKLKGIRGNEIKKWLDEHSENTIKYICLDDDSDFLPEQPLIQTNLRIGFSFLDSLLLLEFFDCLEVSEKKTLFAQIKHEEMLINKKKQFRVTHKGN